MLTVQDDFTNLPLFCLTSEKIAEARGQCARQEPLELQNMRVTLHQIQTIQHQIHHFLGDRSAIWLFGSRLDDSQKGGDVDLYVEAAQHKLMDTLRCKIALQDALDAPVDLIVRKPLDASPIAQIAKN